MRWVVEAYLTANPSMRVVLVTPQYASWQSQAVIQQYVNAELAYGASMGVPVLNMYAAGGVNSITASTLTVDGIHPSGQGYGAFFAPTLRHFLEAQF